VEDADIWDQESRIWTIRKSKVMKLSLFTLYDLWFTLLINCDHACKVILVLQASKTIFSDAELMVLILLFPCRNVYETRIKWDTVRNFFW
jgi:hypothetical protein